MAQSTCEQPPRVVIADDHELTLQFYAELLRQQGCPVALAQTGAEAVAQVRATWPDVAVVDIQMPELDGLSAIRQIRANPAVGTLPKLWSLLDHTRSEQPMDGAGPRAYRVSGRVED